MKASHRLFIAAALLAFTLLVPAILRADGIDDLELLTENYPPFNFERDGHVRGFAVDLLVEMLQRAGSSKTREDIEVLPWTKGYKAAQTRKNTLLFSTTRFAAREKLFKWVGPIFPNDVVVIAKKARNIRLDTPRDMTPYKIGVVRDDVAELLLLQAGVAPGNFYETVSGSGGENLGKMLAADRIDLWAYGKMVAMWNLRESGFSPGDFEAVYVLQKSDLYFALHKETDDAIVGQLQRALDDLRASGKLREIIGNYLPDFQFQEPRSPAVDG